MILLPPFHYSSSQLRWGVYALLILVVTWGITDKFIDPSERHFEAGERYIAKDKAELALGEYQKATSACYAFFPITENTAMRCLELENVMKS